MKAYAVVAVAVLLLVACGSDDLGTSPGTDSGPGSDSPSSADSGAGLDMDATASSDAGGSDSEIATDAGSQLDSGSRPDSGETADAGTTGGSWTLTDDARRAFLYHYAPLLFIRARSGSSERGRDWVTNFDFDQDGDFSNNKDNWEDLDRFIAGARAGWDIRPTLYTGLIEFMTEDRKDLILLYHVYHAKQRGSIHDWERVEIRVNGVEVEPGGDEQVAYVVITEHGKHNVRVFPHSDLNFLETTSGAHPMIWQAEGTRESGLAGLRQDFYNAELHFVEDSWAVIERRGASADAEVDVNGGGDQDFHYLFVPQGDPAAVESLGARPITAASARALSSSGSTTEFRSVRRITYELQDLADIFPTHWEPGTAARHWTTPRVSVLFETPLAAGVAGSVAVPEGLQTFLSESLDDEDEDEDRRGYPRKHWFWGAYTMGDSSGFSAAYNDGAPAGTRAVANGDPASLGAYFHQHDYFVHEGSARPLSREPRGWLRTGWHRAAEGGFDGRWVQLFD